MLAELVTTDSGLTSQEAALRLLRYGSNDAAAAEACTGLASARSGFFANPLVIILLVASALSAATGDVASFVIIASIVLLSVLLDFVQESRAQNAVDALRQQVALRADVRRDGAEASLPVDQLVPGDIVRLTAGDLVPADGVLLSSRDFFVNQALLTGESFPVEKRAADARRPGGRNQRSGQRGARRHLGDFGQRRLARLPNRAPHNARPTRRHADRQAAADLLRNRAAPVQHADPAHHPGARCAGDGGEHGVPPALDRVPDLRAGARGGADAGTAADDHDHHPRARRGPAVAQRVIVKSLPAIHNLGAMDVLCTDKTGTLTEARIALTRHIDITGDDSERVLTLAWLNSHFESGLKSPLDDAILAHGTIDPSPWRKIDEVPFDFERRRVSVLVERDGARTLIIKGAPEDVIRICTAVEMPDGASQALTDELSRGAACAASIDLSAQGFRLLGIASRAEPPDQATGCAGRRDGTDLCRLRGVPRPAQGVRRRGACRSSRRPAWQ